MTRPTFGHLGLPGWFGALLAPSGGLAFILVCYITPPFFLRSFREYYKPLQKIATIALTCNFPAQLQLPRTVFSLVLRFHTEVDQQSNTAIAS